MESPSESLPTNHAPITPNSLIDPLINTSSPDFWPIFEQYLEPDPPPQSHWDAYIYPISIYLVGLACFAAAVNVREKYRAPLIMAFLAIGVELEQYISGLEFDFDLKDLCLKVIAVQVMGSVVMVLREKFVLTEEQKNAGWKGRAIATYKVMWNGRFIATRRPAPIYRVEEEKEEERMKKQVDAARGKRRWQRVGKKGKPGLQIRKVRHGQKKYFDQTDPHMDTRDDDIANVKNDVDENFAARIFGPATRWLAVEQNWWLVTTLLWITGIAMLDNAMTNLFDTYAEFAPYEVLPKQATYFRRLVRNQVTLRETLLRLYFSLHSTWAGYVWFTWFHDACGLFFVGIGVDEPEEWPPLFGDVRQAWSVRRFWSKFFDRLIYRSVSGWGEMLMQGVGLGRRPYSGAKRWLLNGLIFVIGGLVHAVTDRLAGAKCAFWSEMWWWMSNFFVICAETAFLALLQKVCPRVYNAMSGRIGRTIGYAWVVLWLFYAVPKNM